MYFRDKLQMPFTENAFKLSGCEQEIIEEYDELKEIEWRKMHRENVKKMKQIEAEERKQEKKNVDKEILDMLDELELIEELNEELVAFNQSEIQENMQNSTQKIVELSPINDDDDDENYTDSSVDDHIPKPFRKLTKQSKDMSLDEQLEFFQSHSDDLQTFLSQSKPTTFEELNEKTDKIVLYDYLKQKLDDLRTEIKREKKRKQITELNANIVVEDQTPAIENYTKLPNENVVVTEKPLRKRVSFDNHDQIHEFSSADDNCNKLSVTIDNSSKSTKLTSSSLTYHLKIQHTDSVFSGDLKEKIVFTNDNAVIRHPADVSDWYETIKITLHNSTTLKSILKSKRNVLNTDAYTHIKPLNMETNLSSNNDIIGENDDDCNDDDIQKRKEEFNKIMDDMFGEVFQRSDPKVKPTVVNHNNNSSEKPLIVEKPNKVSVNSTNERPRKKISLFKQSRQK